MTYLASYPSYIVDKGEKFYPPYPWQAVVKLAKGSVVITLDDNIITVLDKKLWFSNVLYKGDCSAAHWDINLFPIDTKLGYPAPTSISYFIRQFLCQIYDLEMISVLNNWRYEEFTGPEAYFIRKVPKDFIGSPIMVLFTEFALLVEDTALMSKALTKFAHEIDIMNKKEK